MENMKASQRLDEIKVAAVEFKIAALAGEPDILSIPGHLLHLIGGDDYLQRVPLRMELHSLGGLIRADAVKISTDKAYVDLESGLIRNCKCCWKDECPKYVVYANDPIERVVKELKDKSNALKFISIERVKELKDEGYGLFCSPFGPVKGLKDEGYGWSGSPFESVKVLKGEGYGWPGSFEPVKGLKDDGDALKVIPVEAVKVSKDDGCASKFIPVETVEELKAHGYALFIPAEIVKKLKDEYNIKMESGGMIEALVNKSWLKNKFVEYFGYANDYIEKIVKPKTGILFSGAIMQNIYQLVTSGMVNTGKGKTLMKLNEAAFMMLLYGLVMPRRAAGHIALAIGVALASAAYLVTMSFAF